ncbi:TIGR02391 family protein [Flavobacterium sharifuzzamanii]|uniref:TIGR02391 family protein n=1 Tax=Flavobacterium sharifuzzamanii TaxID=2211133 RepID=UPI000DAB7E62|nr:TIGR02391 family protein [Flavobacterium sharifuzzamanii]KAF2082086.1 TIGR02391 family protein [Flavobacterium sharifuzzamanii]
MIQNFDPSTLRSISNIVGEQILTHKQINEQFHNAGLFDTNEGTNKADRIYYTLISRQKQDNCANNVLNFLLKIIDPKRYDNEASFEKHRTSINEKLLFEGIEIDKEGKPKNVTKAKTISEAKNRSLKIKERVHGIGIHRDILAYCESEWLNENYFHAILEITKSVAHKLRQKSGYASDGAILVDECFGLGSDKKPMLAFNLLQSESEESEHKGFSNFVKGFFSMYRNPKAHDPKLLEDTQLTEMTEVLVVATIIQNKLDITYKTGYK